MPGGAAPGGPAPRGCLLQGGACSRGCGIPACTKADHPPPPREQNHRLYLLRMIHGKSYVILINIQNYPDWLPSIELRKYTVNSSSTSMITDTSKNITLATTSLRPAITFYIWIRKLLICLFKPQSRLKACETHKYCVANVVVGQRDLIRKAREETRS